MNRCHTADSAEFRRRLLPGNMFQNFLDELPVRLGSTRTVGIIGGVRLDEVFWAWQPERRIGFRVTASSTQMIAALLECFDVTPLGTQRCTLRWRMAAELRGSVGMLEPGIRAALAPSMRRMMARLERVAAVYPLAAD